MCNCLHHELELELGPIDNYRVGASASVLLPSPTPQQPHLYHHNIRCLGTIFDPGMSLQARQPTSSPYPATETTSPSDYSNSLLSCAYFYALYGVKSNTVFNDKICHCIAEKGAGTGLLVHMECPAEVNLNLLLCSKQVYREGIQLLYNPYSAFNLRVEQVCSSTTYPARQDLSSNYGSEGRKSRRAGLSPTKHANKWHRRFSSPL